MNKKTGKITVKHVYQALSAGLAVSIGGIENQIVGGVTQVLSRLLVEQYRYSKTNVTSTDFVSYPILRFKDAPKVTPIVVQWTQRPVHGRRRRAGRDGGRRRRRERVLRRDRRADAGGADDAGARARGLKQPASGRSSLEGGQGLRVARSRLRRVSRYLDMRGGGA